MLLVHYAEHQHLEHTEAVKYRNFKGPGKGRLGPSCVGILWLSWGRNEKTDFSKLLYRFEGFSS